MRHLVFIFLSLRDVSLPTSPSQPEYIVLGCYSRARLYSYNLKQAFRIPGTNTKHSCQLPEGESFNAFFNELQEGSDVELDASEGESISISDDTLPPSPVSDTTSKANIVNNHALLEALTAPSVAHTVSEPFPLFKLPLSVRKSIYEYLLVVPGLICIRQNQTLLYEENQGCLHADSCQLLPGIAHAFNQLSVNGYKIPFSRFATTSINILLASKEVYAEAKPLLYSKNNFDIPRPSTELIPPTDLSVRLFPPGCQRLVAKLNIRIRSFYDLNWLLNSGYTEVKNFYRGLSTLTLILEIDSTNKGFGRQWAKQDGEKWNVYIRRLQMEIGKHAFASSKGKKVMTIPAWINLRVLFGGESYDQDLRGNAVTTTGIAAQPKRDELRNALVEAWELFKKGGR
ncbi:hypothetical protein BDU57DRAFT_587875 [Ampelomyces quisqualis]|uniref:DUF7730 domain-containing protein n=1 Tax=Ampelomyces quisqualis TaxID=50730 RepID=A0A6A5QMP4_AMPQU|nr:hypothetical protein BDU57DRAFT_587875 [Ampelomyces quisqualis]